MSLNFFRELFSLSALAERTIFYDSEIIKFIIHGDSGEKIEKEVNVKSREDLKTDSYYKSYEWVLDDFEDKIKKETKLNIFRNYLRKRQTFAITDDPTHIFRALVQNLIKGETDKYFEQQNKIKDEFVELTKISFQAHQSLFKIGVGVLISIGIAYYGLIINNEDFDIKVRDYRIGLVFLFGFIGLVFSLLVFYREVRQIQELYEKLKKIYVDQFGFSKNQFDQFVNKPKFWCDNKLILSFIITLSIIFSALTVYHFEKIINDILIFL
ncbi:hypothetical protein [Salinicoccus sp. CNSTN-B1]